MNPANASSAPTLTEGSIVADKYLIEGMVVFGRDGKALDVSDLPLDIRARSVAPREVRVHIGMTMDEVERHFIEENLKAFGHDKQKTARALGIALRTLYRKMKEYGIDG